MPEPEILLPSSTSIISSSSSSTASSLLLYTDRTLSRRKSLPLRRISGWQWLTRRIPRQGLNINATHALPNHTHHHHHHHSPSHYDHDYDGNERILSSPQRRKTLAFDAESDYEAEQGQARQTEREIAESYAAYCQSFTSAGVHQYQHQHQHKRKTWMMDGLIDMDHTISSDDFSDSNDSRMHTVHVHAENDEEECVDEKRERSEPEPEPQPQQRRVLPPPQILTPSLYAEMRRAEGACDRKRARLRQRRLWLWSWSWFPHIRPRESRSH